MGDCNLGLLDDFSLFAFIAVETIPGESIKRPNV